MSLVKAADWYHVYDFVEAILHKLPDSFQNREDAELVAGGAVSAGTYPASRPTSS